MHAGIDVHAVFKPGDVIKAVVTSISEEDRPRRKLARPQGAGAGLLNTQRDTGSKGGAGRQQHEVKLRITLATEPLELFLGAMLEDAQAVYADAVAAQRPRHAVDALQEERRVSAERGLGHQGRGQHGCWGRA